MSVKMIQDIVGDDAWYDEEELGTVVEDSGWMSEGKYDYRTVVIEVRNSDHGFDDGFYRLSQSRQGSYHSDYYYDTPHVEKVEPYTETITVTKYRKVK